MNPSPKLPPFTHSELLTLAEALAGAASHSLLLGLFHEANLVEVENIDGLSKPKRIFNAIAGKQSQTATGNFAIRFTQIALKPHRYINDPQKHEATRERVNQVLAFRGIFFDSDAKVRFTQNSWSQSSTLDISVG